MDHSEDFTAIASALAKASAEFEPVKRNRTATIRTRAGGEYTYSYATLDAILEAVRPALSKHELVLVQSQVFVEVTSPDRGHIVVTREEFMETRLIHSSAQYLANSVPLMLPADEDLDARAYGSAQTYARRYGITALLCIVAEDDDDAEAATAPIGRSQRGGSTRRTKPATDKQVKLILDRLQRVGATEHDLCTAMEIEAIGTLPMDRVDEALALIDEGLQFAGDPPSQDQARTLDQVAQHVRTMRSETPEERKKREHDEALRDDEVLRSMEFIRNNLKSKPLEAAAEWRGFSPQLQQQLWLAPTKGGWFTTAERKALSEAISQLINSKKK